LARRKEEIDSKLNGVVVPGFGRNFINGSKINLAGEKIIA
jgi:hypothetical protein